MKWRLCWSVGVCKCVRRANVNEKEGRGCLTIDVDRNREIGSVCLEISKVFVALDSSGAIGGWTVDHCMTGGGPPNCIFNAAILSCGSFPLWWASDSVTWMLVEFLSMSLSIAVAGCVDVAEHVDVSNCLWLWNFVVMKTKFYVLWWRNPCSLYSVDAVGHDDCIEWNAQKGCTTINSTHQCAKFEYRRTCRNQVLTWLDFFLCAWVCAFFDDWTLFSSPKIGSNCEGERIL